MQVDKNHRLLGCQWNPSEYYDDRPRDYAIELVVVHCVSLPEGQFGTGYPEELFTGKLDLKADESFFDLKGAEVSPHLFIDRQGEVTQLVSFDKRAWHAGVSTWRKRPNCNDYSIGVELEGSNSTSCEEKQYLRLREVLSALFLAYDRLSLDSVVGHNEIAPERKTDPGKYFDWTKVYSV